MKYEATRQDGDGTLVPNGWADQVVDWCDSEGAARRLLPDAIGHTGPVMFAAISEGAARRKA